MIKISERALEFAKMTADVIKVIRESNNGLPAIAKENLLKTRMILKSALKQIDEIFDVEEVE